MAPSVVHFPMKGTAPNMDDEIEQAADELAVAARVCAEAHQAFLKTCIPNSSPSDNHPNPGPHLAAHRDWLVARAAYQQIEAKLRDLAEVDHAS